MQCWRVVLKVGDFAFSQAKTPPQAEHSLFLFDVGVGCLLRIPDDSIASIRSRRLMSIPSSAASLQSTKGVKNQNKKIFDHRCAQENESAIETHSNGG